MRKQNGHRGSSFPLPASPDWPDAKELPPSPRKVAATSIHQLRKYHRHRYSLFCESISRITILNRLYMWNLNICHVVNLVIMLRWYSKLYNLISFFLFLVFISLIQAFDILKVKENGGYHLLQMIKFSFLKM